MEPLADPAAAKRKLATILSADVKAFSRLMEADEEATRGRSRPIGQRSMR